MVHLTIKVTINLVEHNSFINKVQFSSYAQKCKHFCFLLYMTWPKSSWNDFIA